MYETPHNPKSMHASLQNAWHFYWRGSVFFISTLAYAGCNANRLRSLAGCEHTGNAAAGKASASAKRQQSGSRAGPQPKAKLWRKLAHLIRNVLYIKMVIYFVRISQRVDLKEG